MKIGYRILGSCVCALVLAGPVTAAVCDGVSPVNNTTLESVVIANGLDEPILVLSPPGDTDRLFFVSQNGEIRVKQRGTPPGTHSLYLDVSGLITNLGNEQGLLGMAFDPDFQNNRRFYLSYTRVGGNGITVIARYEQDPLDPDQADPLTPPALLMTLAQPENNHNGGHIAFGPDGFLYIGLGDGGGGGDQHGACGHGQNLGTLFGAMLRIDPNNNASEPSDCGGVGAYTIPDDNPFVDGLGGDCDEIWAYGLRNPWRWSFDSANGDLYIADVGQSCWEEVNWVAGGGAGGENYGWRQMEGTHCYNPSQGCNAVNAANCTPACNDPSLTLPVTDFLQFNLLPCSVTGGYVYRGCRMPNFDGTYFYGDYCDGRVRSFEISGGAAINADDWTAQVDPGGALLFGLTSFGTDAQGEIYITDQSGEVRKLMPPLADMEVSGIGVLDAEQFLPNNNADWTWEDLEFNSMRPISHYNVYSGQPGGTFACIHSTIDTSWTGDPSVPAPGSLLAYLVTGVDGASESSGGNPPRTLTSPCAAP